MSTEKHLGVILDKKQNPNAYLKAVQNVLVSYVNFAFLFLITLSLQYINHLFDLSSIMQMLFMINPVTNLS